MEVALPVIFYWIGTENEKFAFELVSLHPMKYEQIADLLNGMQDIQLGDTNGRGIYYWTQTVSIQLKRRPIIYNVLKRSRRFQKSLLKSSWCLSRSMKCRVGVHVAE
ncbi:glutamate--cysteine ligase A, chloroplastic-like [Papaver somniferum]|uniref:glutamate--cysteine ligase A, chloroplastic-like n=1 Tax=Papaver somniferum TaxID=3469 RepID=UPI000E6FF21F|nr:glutamate--cysteine ligase A, chloroplastic-like [Papaver somniferum]